MAGHDLHYLRERYQDNPSAGYGLLASSRDKGLCSLGIPNGYFSTRRVRHGHWYNDDEIDLGQLSRRHLKQCVTEFGAQGLGLDAALLAWGTDFQIVENSWSIEKGRNYLRQGHSKARDPAQLRAKTYRVLLTRGRDAHVVFVPLIPELDPIIRFLVESGFTPLK